MITPEDFFLQDVLLPLPSPALFNLTYRYDFLENPSDMRSAQEVTPDSFLIPHYDLAPLGTSPQTVIPVNDGAGPCVIYSVSTPPSPPIPTSQTAQSYPPNWCKIPQTIYNHGKKQWDFRPSEPVLFHVDGRPGVNMGNAFRKKFTGLQGRDDLVLQDAPSAISCRLWVRSSCKLFPRTRFDGPINSSLAIPLIAHPRYYRSIVPIAM